MLWIIPSNYKKFHEPTGDSRPNATRPHANYLRCVVTFEFPKCRLYAKPARVYIDIIQLPLTTSLHPRAINQEPVTSPLESHKHCLETVGDLEKENEKIRRQIEQLEHVRNETRQEEQQLAAEKIISSGRKTNDSSAHRSPDITGEHTNVCATGALDRSASGNTRWRGALRWCG